MTKIKVTLTRMTPDPAMAAEEAASQCYQSEPSPDGKIMRSCYLSGHHSTLEHVNFTWHIEGVSRSLLAQLTRHRIGTAFSVMSQRYCAMNHADHFVPLSVRDNPEARFLYDNFMKSSVDVYERLQSLGIPNEDARYVLTNACHTTLQCTMNLRELIHFCNERLCTRAQYEIRSMCNEMVRTVNEATSCSFADFLVPKCEAHPSYPFCTERQSCGKHPKLRDVYIGYENYQYEQKKEDGNT